MRAGWGCVAPQHTYTHKTDRTRKKSESCLAADQHDNNCPQVLSEKLHTVLLHVRLFLSLTSAVTQYSVLPVAVTVSGLQRPALLGFSAHHRW